MVEQYFISTSSDGKLLVARQCVKPASCTTHIIASNSCAYENVPETIYRQRN